MKNLTQLESAAVFDSMRAAAATGDVEALRKWRLRNREEERVARFPSKFPGIEKDMRKRFPQHYES